ncbi:MAG: hypothetical protein ACR2KB_15765 [Chitinophagaceae bacterium]
MADNIELMHSYPDFPKDSIEAFKNLTVKYNLQPTVDGICSVSFDNEFCRLNFNMDRYDLQGLLFPKQGLLFKKTDDFSFGITQIANLLYPDHNLADSCPKTTYGDKQAIRQLLFWYANLVEKCLETVLAGNFSWYDKQKATDLYERKLVGVILGKYIDYEHPISKKFWSGDTSWRQDIETFIKNNDIKLE